MEEFVANGMSEGVVDVLEDLSAATMEYFYSADKLCDLVGSHDQFVAGPAECQESKREMARGAFGAVKTSPRTLRLYRDLKFELVSGSQGNVTLCLLRRGRQEN